MWIQNLKNTFYNDFPTEFNNKYQQDFKKLGTPLLI